MTKRNPLVALFLMLLSILLGSGCSNASPTTYDEIDAEATRTWEAYREYDYTAENDVSFAETWKAARKARKRLAEFEKNVRRADDYYRLKQLCLASSTTVWLCSSGQPPKVRSNEELHEFVRRYKRERMNGCNCVDN